MEMNRERLPPKPNGVTPEKYFLYVYDLFQSRKRRGQQLLVIPREYRALRFPQRLYILLESEVSSSIGWDGDGTSFTVHDKERFMREVCPNYFQRKY